MRIIAEQDGTLQLREVYSPIDLKTSEGELLTICMRDSGFEFFYQGTKYSAQDGEIKKVSVPKKKVYVETNPLLM